MRIEKNIFKKSTKNYQIPKLVKKKPEIFLNLHEKRTIFQIFILSILDPEISIFRKNLKLFSENWKKNFLSRLKIYKLLN